MHLIFSFIALHNNNIIVFTGIKSNINAPGLLLKSYYENIYWRVSSRLLLRARLCHAVRQSATEKSGQSQVKRQWWNRWKEAIFLARPIFPRSFFSTVWSLNSAEHALKQPSLLPSSMDFCPLLRQTKSHVKKL